MKRTQRFMLLQSGILGIDGSTWARTHSVVFIDTAPLIYLFKQHPRFHAPVRRLLDEVYASGAQMLTSMVTYIELVTQPRRLGNERLAARYRDFLTHADQLRLMPLGLPAADKAASLRAELGLKTPDAIQLATAITNGASHVVTNDRRWERITEVQLVQVSDLVENRDLS